MTKYNHQQFIEWLNGALEKEKQSKLLIEKEKKLSDYWLERSKRRAKNAGRKWPNGDDRQWGLEQQEKSQNVNLIIHNLFEKDIEESEKMVDEVGKMMRKVKTQRNKLKAFKETKKKKLRFKSPKNKVKPKKAGIAPGESFGGLGAGGGLGGVMQESAEKDGWYNKWIDKSMIPPECFDLLPIELKKAMPDEDSVLDFAMETYPAKYKEMFTPMPSQFYVPVEDGKYLLFDLQDHGVACTEVEKTDITDEHITLPNGWAGYAIRRMTKE